MLNIHPSLLPKYQGLHTHKRAIEARDSIHGATVHFVTAELDGGPPIVQAAVDIEPNDDEKSLAAKVLKKEHIIYPLAVRWLSEGIIEMKNGKCFHQGSELPENGLMFEIE